MTLVGQKALILQMISLSSQTKVCNKIPNVSHLNLSPTDIGKLSFVLTQGFVNDFESIDSHTTHGITFDELSMQLASTSKNSHQNKDVIFQCGL